MYTQSAEAMWNRLTDHVSDVKYSLKMTLLGLDSFAKNFSPDQPRLSKIILLDSLVSHLYAICWAEKEGVNVKTSKSSSSSTSSASASTTTAAGGSSASSSATTLTGSSSEGGMSAVNSSSSVSTAMAQNDGIPTATLTEVSRADLTKALMTALLDVLEILREAT